MPCIISGANVGSSSMNDIPEHYKKMNSITTLIPASTTLTPNNSSSGDRKPDDFSFDYNSGILKYLGHTYADDYERVHYGGKSLSQTSISNVCSTIGIIAIEVNGFLLPICHDSLAYIYLPTTNDISLYFRDTTYKVCPFWIDLSFYRDVDGTYYFDVYMHYASKASGIIGIDLNIKVWYLYK